MVVSQAAVYFQAAKRGRAGVMRGELFNQPNNSPRWVNLLRIGEHRYARDQSIIAATSVLFAGVLPQFHAPSAGAGLCSCQ